MRWRPTASVTEALTNVVRHASRHAAGLFASGSTAVALDVVDDGVGVARRERGRRLAAMRERVPELGGTMAVTNAPHGTASTGLPAVLP